MTGSANASLTAATSPDQLGFVAAMSRDFAESQDIHATLQRGLSQIADALSAEAASLFLLDKAGREVTCTRCYGPVDITGLKLEPGEGIVGRSIAENAAQLVRDVAQDADFKAEIDASTGFTTRSILCAPMSVRDQRLGAVELLNKRDGKLFDDTDRRLLEALAASAGLALYNARLANDMLERARIRRELELAAHIQRGLLPVQDRVAGPVHGINVPVREVSGDFYDIVPLPDGRIWFNIGDVSGKGLDAAILMAKTSSLFACLAKMSEDPASLVATIDRELAAHPRHGMFVTLLVGLYEPGSGKLSVLNAGHEPALVVEADGTLLAQLPAGAPPIGLAPEIRPPGPAYTGGQVQHLRLDGQCLYAFTDGLTEATDSSGTPLGAAGVRDLIAAHGALPPAERLAQIIAGVRQPGGKVSDDLTLVVVDPAGAGPDGGT